MTEFKCTYSMCCLVYRVLWVINYVCTPHSSLQVWACMYTQLAYICTVCTLYVLCMYCTHNEPISTCRLSAHSIMFSIVCSQFLWFGDTSKQTMTSFPCVVSYNPAFFSSPKREIGSAMYTTIAQSAA